MSSSPPSPPFLGRLWPTLLLVLTAFGIPAATAALFTRFVTEHPLLALGIGLLYELIVFVLGFVAKVWQRLEVPWVERTAAWFDHWLLNTISRYQKQYSQYLCYQHRDFDLKGLSIRGTFDLELDQAFVELQINQTTAHGAITNPIQVPQEPHEESHAIWDYLAATPLHNQNLVIIGPPGSGKTTLLKHIALTLVSPQKPHHRLHEMGVSHKLPILLFLRDHATAIKEQANFSLVDAVHDHLKKWEQPSPPTDWFKRRLTQGRCLIMLDGLDEVADPEVRQNVVDWVERQMAAYRKNRFIIASRPLGYRSNPLSRVTVLEVCSFTTEQVEQFIHQWYLANEIMSKQKDDPGVRMRARAGARALLQRLRSTPALFDLTVNPLLLTMIANVHRYSGELPGKRVALYAEICKVFFGKRQIVRGQVLALTPEQMQRVLEPLAYHMMEKGIRDITRDEVRTVIESQLMRVNSQIPAEMFLQLVEQVSGLLLERENGVYSFAHLTFQEYLTASYIHEKQLGQTLIAGVGAVWWQETIRLYCAMADATPIIAACLVDDRPPASAVELAIDCDKEALEVQPEMRTRLETLLEQGVEDPDPEWQHVIAGALLVRRLRRMAHLRSETYADTSLISCAEYQLFLDEQRSRGAYLQPDHWTSYHFARGQGSGPALGIRSSDAVAFCSWLTAREPSPWLYRLPEEGELESEGIPSRLPRGIGYWLKDGKGFIWAGEARLVPDNVLKELDLIFAHTLSNVPARDLELARELEIALGRARARDLDLASTSDFVRDLEHILASVGVRSITTLTLALEHIIGCARNLASRSDLASARELAIALELASERARASGDPDLASDLERARERISTITSNLVSAYERTHIYTLVPDLERDLDLTSSSNPELRFTNASERARERAHAHTLALACDLERTREHTRIYTLALDLGHTTRFANKSNLALALERALKQARDIALALERISALELAQDLASARDLASDLERALTRDLVLVFIYDLASLSSRRRIWQRFFYDQARKQREIETQRLIDSLLDLYIDLVILEKRIRGELPACEGILLVKERK